MKMYRFLALTCSLLQTTGWSPIRTLEAGLKVDSITRWRT